MTGPNWLMRLVRALGLGVLVVAVWPSAAGAATWSIQPTSGPTGATDSYLGGVSCTSARSCIAVGGYETASGAYTLAEHWNGTKWYVQHTPNPSGVKNSNLEAVSCTSARSCVAVGSYANAGDTVGFTLVESWNGTSWSIQHSPNPLGAKVSFLAGVSCTSAQNCVAVGNSGNATSTIGHTLAERWNGTRWSLQHTPNPTGAEDSTLGAVSCTSARSCTAVGLSGTPTSYTGYTLAERWNGTNWSIQTTPNPPSGTDEQHYLNGVSCISARSCTAVGQYETASGTVSLVERWNGTSWSAVHSPDPAGADYAELGAVSCTSAQSCIAIGVTDIGKNPDHGFAERWNGTSWTVQHTPAPKGAAYSDLNAVSCSTEQGCTAVGTFGRSISEHAPIRTLAERY